MSLEVYRVEGTGGKTETASFLHFVMKYGKRPMEGEHLMNVRTWSVIVLLTGLFAVPTVRAEPESQILQRLGELKNSFFGLRDGEAQTETMIDCRNVGNALMAWIVDELSAAAAGADTADVEIYPISSYEELKEHLVPRYISDLPRTDGWGHPYEYRVAWNDPLAQNVMLIRSPGKDGEFSGSTYEPGSFDPDDVDQDIVWGDGFFLRWPERHTGP